MTRPAVSNEPTLSVVVPIYNIASYIERCVASILQQGSAVTEILLIDDGSTDSSGSLCDALAEQDERIRVFHKPNGGLSDARNFGLHHAGGDYLLFLDGDDYLVDDACGRILQDVRQFHPDVVIGNVDFLRQFAAMQRWERAVAAHFDFHKPYTGKQYLQTCLRYAGLRVEIGRHMYRTAYLRDHHFLFPQGLVHEDEYFTPLVLLQAEQVILTDQVFYHYDNRRPDSIMNAPERTARRMLNMIKVCDALAAQYRTVTPRILRRRLENDLCWKYLNAVAHLPPETRAEELPSRLQLLRLARSPQRRCKAALYAVSPRLYRRLFAANRK